MRSHPLGAGVVAPRRPEATDGATGVQAPATSGAIGARACRRRTRSTVRSSADGTGVPPPTTATARPPLAYRGSDHPDGPSRRPEAGSGGGAGRPRRRRGRPGGAGRGRAHRPRCALAGAVERRRRARVAQVREPAARRVVQDPRRVPADRAARRRGARPRASSPRARATTRRAWRSPPGCSAPGPRCSCRRGAPLPKVAATRGYGADGAARRHTFDETLDAARGVRASAPARCSSTPSTTPTSSPARAPSGWRSSSSARTSPPSSSAPAAAGWSRRDRRRRGRPRRARRRRAGGGVGRLAAVAGRRAHRSRSPARPSRTVSRSRGPATSLRPRARAGRRDRHRRRGGPRPRACCAASSGRSCWSSRPGRRRSPRCWSTRGRWPPGGRGALRRQRRPADARRPVAPRPRGRRALRRAARAAARPPRLPRRVLRRVGDGRAATSSTSSTAHLRGHGEVASR